MNVDVEAAATLLKKWYSFHELPLESLAAALQKSPERPRLRLIERSTEPFIQAGTPVERTIFITAGRVAPWQIPISDLRAPFMLGEHELAIEMDTRPTWICPYSALVETQVLEIPLDAMRALLDLDGVRQRVHRLLFARMSRYIWTSHATTGDPESRVASAIASRLFLRGSAGEERPVVKIDQRELVRLTASSRATVSKGLADLREAGIIEWDVRRVRTDDEPQRTVVVLQCGRLFDRAHRYFAENILGREW